MVYFSLLLLSTPLLNEKYLLKLEWRENELGELSMISSLLATAISFTSFTSRAVQIQRELFIIGFSSLGQTGLYGYQPLLLSVPRYLLVPAVIFLERLAWEWRSVLSLER